ncbi:MAG: hypothetical protein AAF721_19055 [Myxococcota bacterium]
MSSVADATGKFADKLVELLDIFDLSFFVSGAAGLGALIAAARVHGVPLPLGFTRMFDSAKPELGAEILFVGIVASYAVGLGCFALGRSARARFNPQSNAELVRRAAAHHRLGDVLDLAEYLGDGDDGPAADPRLSSLYNRLWVHVRTVKELSTTLSLVKRYWILAATFDGMGIALLAWLWPLGASLVLAPDAGLGGPASVVLAIGLVVSAFFCWRQAAEYRRYQVDELVATAVHWHALQSSERAAVAEA